MKLHKVLKITVILCLLVAFSAEAQTNKYKRRKATNRVLSAYRGFAKGQFKPYLSLAFNINAPNYFGDLAPLDNAGSTDISFTRPGFGGTAEYPATPNLGIRAGLSWGRIKGDDYTSDPNDARSAPRYARNLSFRNDIKELQVGFTYYIARQLGGVSSRPMINGYIFAGIAGIHHEPKGKVPEFDYQANNTTNQLLEAGEWVKLRPLGTEGQNLPDRPIDAYSQFQLAIPLAVGVRLALPGPFDVGLEFGYRFLFTDYIDDVSGVYVDLDRFDDPLARIMSDRSSEPIAVWNGESRLTDLPLTDATFPSGDIYRVHVNNGTGREGSIRGNPDQNDMIFMTSIRVTYHILPKNALSSKIR
jgi:hypothetical protein